VRGVFAARVQFVLCGLATLATIYLTHNMAPTTIYYLLFMEFPPKRVVCLRGAYPGYFGRLIWMSCTNS
jgi:hypothetical protein